MTQKTRFSRFIQNAGIRGVAFFFIVVIGMFFTLRKDLELGILPLTLFVMGIGGFISYRARSFLVDSLPYTKYALNILLLTGWITLAIFKESLPHDDTWFRVLLTGGFATYLGCYFWLLSDERVTT